MSKVQRFVTVSGDLAHAY